MNFTETSRIAGYDVRLVRNLQVDDQHCPAYIHHPSRLIYLDYHQARAVLARHAQGLACPPVTPTDADAW